MLYVVYWEKWDENTSLLRGKKFYVSQQYYLLLENQAKEEGYVSLELSKNYGNCQKLVVAHAIDCQYSCHLHKKFDLLVKVVVGLP